MPTHVDLWWTKSFWDTFFSWVLLFFPESIIPIRLSTYTSSPYHWFHTILAVYSRQGFEATTEQVMSRVTYCPLEDRSGGTWMGNCGLVRTP
jgi:hypothetical protein